MDKNSIINTDINGLNVTKIFSSETTDTLLITLEKNKVFPTHSSPKSTLIVVLEGIIDFHIEDKTITLGKHQTYTFNKDIKHHVTALNDAKFLIIR
ncbi:cupin domain-containing protein [Flavobacteriaceae bacterium F08102]|nr:cupin domain-containing protein [Flavobacteriaceae bacterium F08102]